MSEKMNSLLNEERYAERNELVLKWRELRSSIDYGFRVGQVVERRKNVKNSDVYEREVIKSISETWEITFKNITIPVEFVRKVEGEEVESQLSLF